MQKRVKFQSDCIADRSVAENYLRLVINARRLL